MLTILTCAEVADRLRVSQKQAAKIMRELPHSDCSGDVRGSYKTLRITENVLEGFMRGEIERTPAGAAPARAVSPRNPQQQAAAAPPARGGKKRYAGPIPYR